MFVVDRQTDRRTDMDRLATLAFSVVVNYVEVSPSQMVVRSGTASLS